MTSTLIILATLLALMRCCTTKAACDKDLMEAISPAFNGTSECLGATDVFLPAGCGCDFPVIFKNFGGQGPGLNLAPKANGTKFLTAGGGKDTTVIRIEEEGENECTRQVKSLFVPKKGGRIQYDFEQGVVVQTGNTFIILFDGDLGELPKILDGPSITLVTGKLVTNIDATDVLSVNGKTRDICQALV